MKTTITQVNNGPKAAGPYSLGVIAAGKILFIAGQIPFNPATGKVERGTIEEQTQLALNNIKSIIDAAGAKVENAVACRVFLSAFDTETFQKMNGVYQKFFGPSYPTRTTIGCQLMGFDVEIECTVVMDT
jgi:2-iminobutanoate/2-iminopropanoate deaminase